MACSDADYTYLRELVLAQSCNLIDTSNNSLFETRLTPLTRKAGASNLEDLVSILKQDQAPQLHRAVAEAMTVNDTSFFRDARPFDVLRDTVLPRIMEERKTQRTLRIWSAACSTGQEAYSIAILLREHFAELADWDVKIVGTDISDAVLGYAERARYRRLEVNRGLPGRLLLKYFHGEDDEWEVLPEVRSLCTFQHVNLCEDIAELPRFDLVLLRNVLLYFLPADRTRAFARVFQQMSPQGYLLLGHADQAEDSTNQFHVERMPGADFYRPVNSV